ncbi:MAG: DNA repair protein RecO [Ezakiella sp.]|nr:DNA repair protein RecO [Ezakiella sp.]MDD7761201.1 DNA repair protein RecO [Bacillota bacterium]MDY3946823.1 DNA repair protein RecO [Ezakiella sp.]
MSSKIKVEAIILNTIRWKDTSAISQILTDEFGRVPLVSQGVYLEKKYISPSSLQTLSISKLVVSRGKNMFYLSEVESTNRMDILTKDYKSFLSAHIVIELLQKSLEEGFSIANIYPLTKAYLNSLGKNDAFLLTAAWIFKFMSFMGYRPLICGERLDKYYLNSNGITKTSYDIGEYVIIDKLERDYIEHLLNNRFEDIKKSERGKRMLELAVKYALFNLEINYLNSYESINSWGKYAIN